VNVVSVIERRNHTPVAMSRWTMRSLAGGKQGDPSSALSLTGLGGHWLPTPSSPARLRMAQSFSHNPVMLDQVVAEFSLVPAGLVVDATAGGGGHSAAILSSNSELSVLALDRDELAVAAARAKLEPFGDRARVVHGSFGELARFTEGREISGVLLDLGVSSPQIDTAERGFSWRFDAPLDMRMDQSSGEDAAAYLARVDVQELSSLLRKHGEGRLARRIAEAIVKARPTSTAQLAAVVEACVPAALRRRGHPARRVFQALRVLVNDEEQQLQDVLAQALASVIDGGRIVVLSYHSGEDRVVKAAFDEAAGGGCDCPPRLPCGCGAVSLGFPIRRGAILASAGEIAENPRAEAARMRVFVMGEQQ